MHPIACSHALLQQQPTPSSSPPGTTYRISPDAQTYSSISTRDGGETAYPKALKSVTERVAISILETYGSVANIQGAYCSRL